MTPVGIVLAGGEARRMGGGDKALLRLGESTILAHIADRLAPQVALLAINANGDPSRFAGFGLPVFPDSHGVPIGPLGGILAGMAWAARHCPDIPDIVTVPGDAPFLPDDLVARLSAARRAAGAAVAIAESDGRRHPVVALWPVALAATLRRMIDQDGLRKVGRFAELCGAATALFPALPVDPFTNVNTADDLIRAEGMLRMAATR